MWTFADTCPSEARKQLDSEGSRAAAGREPQSRRLRASPEPPAGAAGTGGRRGEPTDKCSTKCFLMQVGRDVT